jgi:class 3 adenylate cyclase
MKTEISYSVILFADISGSTELYEIYGDVVARSQVAECLNTITHVVEQRQGIVLKTIGDEIMCTFPGMEQGITAACEMQETLEELLMDQSDASSLSIRVGLHYGPAILENNDAFGDAVNVAARVVEMAKPGQIITTRPAVQELSPSLQAITRFIESAAIRGKKDTIDIFEVIWKEDELTRMATRPLDGVLRNVRGHVSLHLSYQDQQIHLNGYRTLAILGRSKSCDLTVDDAQASRQHLKIEYRRGKFFIIDQSTNGTYYRNKRGEESFLRREEMPLSSSGQISLGRSFEDSPVSIIHFKLER